MRNRRNFLILALLGSALGAASTAPAGTPDAALYENDFSSRALYREIRQVGGGDACRTRYIADKNLMRVEVEGVAHCQYRPPVMQAGELPDQRWTISGQVSDETAHGKRYRAYLTSRVRAGLSGYYQLRVHPKSQIWFHSRREPGENQKTLDNGGLNAIRPVGAFNRLFLRATGDTLKGEVNDAGTDFPYEDPEPVVGRGVRFGIGSTIDRPDPVIGYFKLLRVADPG